MTLKHYPAVIKTARLTLRPLQDSDAGLIKLYVGDERVAMNLAVVPHPYPDGAAETYIASARDPANTEIIWAMALSGELIGVISITPQEIGRGNIGYWLAPQFWGAGFMPEALEAVIKYARANGFSQLNAAVHQGNHGSARVVIKEGFEYIGDSESHSIPQGGMVQSWNYRLDFNDG
ncbi:MAG: GNAT family N-acetyltransferase [Paracoccaceae bacterium]